MKSQTHADALQILRQQTRTRRLRGPLALALVGCLVTVVAVYALHPSPFSGEVSLNLFLLWVFGLGASLLSGIGLYWWQRSSSTQVAQLIDAETHSKNRLEAASQFAGLESPVAAAQRDDASDYLSRHAPPRWPVVTLLSLALGLIFLFYSMVSVVWLWNAASAGFAVDPLEEAALEENPRAEIVWVQPKSEIKATEIEAIPLTANVVTTHSLMQPVLQIQVNGAQVSTMPLEVDLGEGAGEFVWEPDLYLDMLEIEAFDLVSYYLQASFESLPEAKPVISAMQFVQVKPLREDVRMMDGMPGAPKETLQLLMKLKSAQLALVKQNFLLTHAGLGPDDEIWVAENQRVHEDQSLLAEKAQQVIELFIAGGAAAEIVDLLLQAKPQMETAAERIAALENESAVEPQGKALSLIIEIEKLIQKVIVNADGGEPPPPKKDLDPFKDDQKYEMPPRAGSAADKLEELEKEQAKLLKDLEALNRPQMPEGAGAPDEAGETEDAPGPGKMTAEELAARQRAIEEALSRLMEKGEFPGTVEDPLGFASREAGDSALQLEAGDSVAARQPAAKALMHIRDALGEMKKASEARTEQALSEAAAKLEEAADELSREGAGAPSGESTPPKPGGGSPGESAAKSAAKKVADAKKGLETEAEREQTTGSKAMAEKLAGLADSIGEKDILKDLEAMDAAGEGQVDAAKLAAVKAAIEEMATRAALEELALRGGNKAFDELAEELTSTQRSLEGLAQRERREAGSAEGSGQDDTAAAAAAPAAATPPETAAPNQGEAKVGEGQQAALLEDLTRNLRMVEKLTAEESVQDAIAKIKKSIETTTAGGPAEESEVKNIDELVRSLEKPMDTVLFWLRSQSLANSRTELLRLRKGDDVPPEYRDSVQLYFEQLSLDYKSKNGGGTEETAEP